MEPKALKDVGKEGTQNNPPLLRLFIRSPSISLLSSNLGGILLSDHIQNGSSEFLLSEASVQLHREMDVNHVLSKQKHCCVRAFSTRVNAMTTMCS